MTTVQDVIQAAAATVAQAAQTVATAPTLTAGIAAAKPSLFLSAAMIAEEMAARLLGLSEPEIALALGLIQHIISNRSLVQSPSIEPTKG